MSRFARPRFARPSPWPQLPRGLAKFANVERPRSVCFCEVLSDGAPHAMLLCELDMGVPRETLPSKQLDVKRLALFIRHSVDHVLGHLPPRRPLAARNKNYS